MHQILDDSKKLFLQKSDEALEMEAKGSVKVTCTDFEVKAKNTWKAQPIPSWQGPTPP